MPTGQSGRNEGPRSVGNPKARYIGATGDAMNEYAYIVVVSPGIPRVRELSELAPQYADAPFAASGIVELTLNGEVLTVLDWMASELRQCLIENSIAHACAALTQHGVGVCIACWPASVLGEILDLIVTRITPSTICIAYGLSAASAQKEVDEAIELLAKVLRECKRRDCGLIVISYIS